MAAACPANSVFVGGRSCALCPPRSAPLEAGVAGPAPLEALRGADRAAAYLAASPYAPGGSRPDEAIFRSQRDAAHQGRSYCGQAAYILDATLYAQCYPDDAEYRNPFQYARVGSAAECFLQGSRAPGANRNNAGGGGGGGGKTL